jgi:hypothetical protein
VYKVKKAKKDIQKQVWMLKREGIDLCEEIIGLLTEQQIFWELGF